MVADTRTPQPGSGSVRQADTHDLLSAYRAALDLAAVPPHSRATRYALLTRLVNLWRPTWGLHRFLIEHIRQRLDTLSRGYSLRLALGQDDGNDVQDREALQQFAASLPPPPSKLRGLLPLLSIAVLSQILVTVAADVESERRTFAQVATVIDLNPAHLNDAVTALMDSSVAVVLDLIGIVTLSVYAVFKPQLSGFQLKRTILDLPGALRGRRAQTPLGKRARDIAVHKHELDLFEALGLPPPSESAFDLWVKATALAFWTALGLYFLVPDPERDVALSVIVLLGCVARLVWLLRRARERTLTRNELVIAHARAEGGRNGGRVARSVDGNLDAAGPRRERSEDRLTDSTALGHRDDAGPA